jgi:hypothetical protein
MESLSRRITVQARMGKKHKALPEKKNTYGKKGW